MMRLPVLLSLSLTLLMAATQPDWNAAGKAWWKNVEYLASDALEGRNVGSPGFDKAADYVAGEYERAGLKPAGKDNYFQPVQFIETALDSSKSSLALIRQGKTISVAVPNEAQLGYSSHSAPSLEAPIVFAGYGLVIPEANYDDLKGLSVKGAVVAFLTGGPEKIDGNLRSHYSSSEERAKALRAAGAVGSISIPNPKSMDVPWARQAVAYGKPRMSLKDSETPGLQFGASWNPEKANQLLAGSGHTFEEILKAADSGQPLPHFSLPESIKA